VRPIGKRPQIAEVPVRPKQQSARKRIRFAGAQRVGEFENRCRIPPL